MMVLVEGEAKMVLAAGRPHSAGLVEDALDLELVLRPAGAEKLEITRQKFPVDRVRATDVTRDTLVAGCLVAHRDAGAPPELSAPCDRVGGGGVGDAATVAVPDFGGEVAEEGIHLGARQHGKVVGDVLSQ